MTMNTMMALVIAALAVAPSDQLAFGDRFFNNNEYSKAEAEYVALKGNPSVPADELEYRLAECARQQNRPAEALAGFRRLLFAYQNSRHADTARLVVAMALEGEDRIRMLRLLDSDRVAPALRAEALFRLGEATGDAAYYERSVKCDRRGRFSSLAQMRRATILAQDGRSESRRQAVTLFLEVAFGKDAKQAENALYMAATTSFADRQYGESESLARRYLKIYPKGSRVEDCREMLVWCGFLSGKFADALAQCGDLHSDGIDYVRAAATLAGGDGKSARPLLVEYLDRYPQGRYRRDAELAVSRIDYAAAQASSDASGSVEAARRSLLLSGSAEDRIRLAWALEQAGRTDEALREYLTVAEKHPNGEEAALAMYRKALIDLRAERWDAAELALSEALAGKLDSQRRADARYWRGMAALRLGHLAEGVAELQTALKDGLTLDRSREARLALADVDFNAGRTNEAVRAYAELVRDGACARMSASKAHTIGRLMPPAEKKTCAQMLVKSESPEWRQAGWAMLGDAEEAMGHIAAAAAAWERCAAEPCETEALAEIAVRLGRLRSANGDCAGAEAILKKAVSLSARNASRRAAAYLALARNSELAGDPKSAKGYATVVATLFEGKPEAAEAAVILNRLEEK